MAQQSLGFEGAATAEGGQGREEGRGARFLPDDPRHLFIGHQRVDQYLKEREQDLAVRLRALLEELDLSCLEQGYDWRGRRPLAPRVLVGLIVYGILHQQWGLRALEGLARRDVGAWWVCAGHQPDHSTIGDFLQRHQAVLSVEFFLTVTRQLVGRMHLKAGVAAADGTVIEAAASHYGALKAEAAAQAAEKAQHAAAADPTDAPQQQRAQAARVVAEVACERTARRAAKRGKDGAVAVAPSEPDAVLQRRKDGTPRPAYKPSLMVHEAGVILAHGVHPSSESALVGSMIAQHKTVCGAVPTTLLLDAGYHSGGLLGELCEQGIDVLSPSGRALREDTWRKAEPAGKFSKAHFRYEPETDTYRCPSGERLTFQRSRRDRDGRGCRHYRAAACSTCSLRSRCTTDRAGRSLRRYEGEEYKEAMLTVLDQPRARAMYLRRGPIAERPIAELRDRQGLKRFHRYGLIGVRLEFSLHCLAFNLKWALHRARFAVFFVAAHRENRPGAVWIITVCLVA